MSDPVLLLSDELVPRATSLSRDINANDASPGTQPQIFSFSCCAPDVLEELRLVALPLQRMVAEARQASRLGQLKLRIVVRCRDINIDYTTNGLPQEYAQTQFEE